MATSVFNTMVRFIDVTKLEHGKVKLFKILFIPNFFLEHNEDFYYLVLKTK